MSNSTQFKAGDRAIVLPTITGIFHYYNAFQFVIIESLNEGIALCLGDTKDIRYLEQELPIEQLAPLPIPYHDKEWNLDQE